MMKKPFTFILVFVGLYSANAQKIENIEIIAFDEPYQVMTVSVDNKNVDYKLSETTKLTGKKTSDMPKRNFKKGNFVDLDFKIEGRERLAKKIELLSEYTPGKETLKGVLESYEGDVAYIDGRKVTIDASTKMECAGKTDCGCTKGMLYLAFSELEPGDFLSVKGEADANGDILANNIEVCQNLFTKRDEELRNIVANSYDAKGMLSVTNPPGLTLPPNSLSQGDISIGAFKYKLYNDIQLQGYVNLIGRKVLPAYVKTPEYQEKHKIEFRFYVIDNNIPNAFAFPNGMVFVNSGLLRLIENEAQLAVVLGHEVAHITHEHGVERLKNNEYMDSELVKSASRMFLKNLFPDEKSTGNSSVVKGIGEAVIATKPSDLSNLFNPKFEAQADRVGLYYAFAAGYDIRESANFWRLMKATTSNSGFTEAIKNDFKKMLLNVNLEVDGSRLSDMTSEVSQKITTNFLNTVYTSHPNCNHRIREINDLLNNVYSDENLNLVVGRESYEKWKIKLK
jgi:hypothetical protein